MGSPATSSTTRIDERGRFTEILSTGTWQTVIHGQMQAGAVLGHHYHKLTRIYLYLTSGSAQVELADVATGLRRGLSLAANEGIFLEPNEAHAIQFQCASEFILVRSKPYDPDDTYPFELSSP